MKSSNTSISPLHRALIAAAIVLGAGNVAALAQTSASRDSSGTENSSNYNSSNNSSGSNANSSSDSMQNSSDTSGNRMSSNNNSDYSSDNSSRRSGSSDKLSWSDKRFVTKAADDGQDEVALARLATEKASNPDVRNFAQQLVQDHTQVNSELMSIASSKNVKLDKDDSTKDRAYRRLSKASGQDFDREFVEHMVDEHEKDIKMFEKEANNAKDQELKEFASKHVDHLRQHLAQAQQLQQSIVPTGRSDRESWKSQSSSGSSSSSNTGSTGFSGHSTNAGATGNSSFDTSSGSSAGSTSSSTSSVR